MQICFNMAKAWQEFVVKGMIKNTFLDESGRQIEGGVRMGKHGLEVYIKNVNTGSETTEPMRLRRLANNMEVLFNPVGKLKPHSIPSGSGKQKDISPTATDCKLECQNPDSALSILNRPPLLQASFSKQQWRAYPNVAPWEPRGIIIWVSCLIEGNNTSIPHSLQILTQETTEDFLDISNAAKGMTTFFNSLHGGASANHLHFQSVYYDHPLAVEIAGTMRMGKYQFLANYPTGGLYFPLNVSVEELWEPIKKIQDAGCPFNLIALPSGFFIFVRNIENETLSEFPGRTFGAINLAGLFITSNLAEYEKVNEESLNIGYKKLSLANEEILKFL